MVNVAGNPRSRLLRLLEHSSAPLSGTELGERLGISRVAVWKHIRQLIDEGYTIESGSRGYRLLDEPDYPTSSSPEIDRSRVHILDESASTMNEAAGRQPPEEGVEFWLARRQLQGRGRERRAWRSPEGGLYCTALFRPRLPAAYASLHLIAAGMALADLIGELCGEGCRFRWPNDLYYGEAKLGGLLLEIDGESQTPARGALGIGINIVAPPRVGDRRTASLAQIAAANGRSAPSRRTFFSALQPVVEEALSEEDAALIRDRFEHRLPDSEKGLVVPAGALRAVRGVTLCGSLIVATDDGRLLEIAPGGRAVGEYKAYR